MDVGKLFDVPDASSTTKDQPSKALVFLNPP